MGYLPAIIAGITLIGAGTWLKGEQYKLEEETERIERGLPSTQAAPEGISPMTVGALAVIGIGSILLVRRKL